MRAYIPDAKVEAFFISEAAGRLEALHALTLYRVGAADDV